MSCNNVSDLAVNGTLAACFGYAGATLASIDPITGAVFGATIFVVSKATKPIFEKLFYGPTANDNSRLVGYVFNTITAIAITAAVSTLIGFPLTFQTGVILTAAYVLSAVIGLSILKCCGCNNIVENYTRG